MGPRTPVQARGAPVLALGLLLAGCSSGRDPVDHLRAALRSQRAAEEARIESTLLRLDSYVGPPVARGTGGTSRFAAYWLDDRGRAQAPAALERPADAEEASVAIVFGAGIEPAKADPDPTPASAVDSSDEGSHASSRGVDDRTRLLAAGYSRVEQAPKRWIEDGAGLLLTLEPREAGAATAGTVLCWAEGAAGEAALFDLAAHCGRELGRALPRPTHRLGFLLGGSPAERSRLIAAAGGTWSAALVLDLSGAGPADAPTLWRPADPESAPPVPPSRALEVPPATALGLLGRAAAVDVGLALGPEALELPVVERPFDPSLASGPAALGVDPAATLRFGLAPDEGFLPEHLAPLERRRAAVEAAFASAAWALADARPSDLERHLETWLIERRLRLGLLPQREVGPVESASWEQHLQGARHWLRCVCLGLDPERAEG